VTRHARRRAAATRAWAVRAAPRAGTPFAFAERMFVLLALALGIAWIAGITVLHMTKLGVHVLLILAFAAICVHLFRARRATGHH
jgi:hypothetical protein